MELTIGDYVLRFPDTTAYETFSCKDYYGVTFTAGRAKYDVLHNHLMGERLNISEGPGCLKDIPFHLGTATFLPPEVTVERVSAEVAGEGSDAAADT